MFTQHNHEGVIYFTFSELDTRGLVHVIGSRRGGISPPPFDTLNVSTAVGDAPENVRENRARLAQIVGVSPKDFVTAWLVHGHDVARVGPEPRGTRVRHRDALITDTPEVPLFMTFADCVPVILYDPEHHAVGLAHAGWRGTAAGVTMRTIAAMQQAYGTRPEALVVALGPAIHMCHYEVGPDVIEAFDVFGRGPVVFERQEDRYYLDLIATNVQQAQMMHVRDVLTAPYCTACRTDLFYSHRAEKGKTGRFGVLVMLPPSHP